MNNFQNDPQMQQYFSSLPPYVQETLEQCSPQVTNLEEMKKCVENLMRQQGN